VADLTFAPTVIAIASCERAGAAEPVQLAFTCVAEAEVVPADGGEPR
jgi:hypothetical protein